MSDLPDSITRWMTAVTGCASLHVERRVGGASRAGYAVDAVQADGSTAELWLRRETGFGPQADTVYSLAREAAVYRALQRTDVRVAPLVAVHPDGSAFLLGRVDGQSQFARMTDEEAQRAVAADFARQLAALHRLDPGEIDLPELGPVGTLRQHVAEEIDEWEDQYRRASGDEPVVALALRWLRANLPDEDESGVRLIQGDTGPGNFMFEGDRVVAVTDWELAHWGDLHDDLGWVLVRDNIDRVPDLAGLLRCYEEAVGRRIDADRLRYFRVLAQLRTMIGTFIGLQTRHRQVEIAWQMIYYTLHNRLLGEAMAEVLQVELPPVVARSGTSTAVSWVYDLALEELRETIAPAIEDPFAANRVKGVARIVKYLREVDRSGETLATEERAELEALLGSQVEDIPAARRRLSAAAADGTLPAADVLAHCLRQMGREEDLMRPAMGSLADRRSRSVVEVLTP